MTQPTEYMGQLLDPKPVAEIVITHYENDQLNYQIEGMGKPVPSEFALKMLELVAREVIKQIKQGGQETPHE